MSSLAKGRGPSSGRREPRAAAAAKKRRVDDGGVTSSISRGRSTDSADDHAKRCGKRAGADRSRDDDDVASDREGEPFRDDDYEFMLPPVVDPSRQPNPESCNGWGRIVATQNGNVRAVHFIDEHFQAAHVMLRKRASDIACAKTLSGDLFSKTADAVRIAVLDALRTPRCEDAPRALAAAVRRYTVELCDAFARTFRGLDGLPVPPDERGRKKWMGKRPFIVDQAHELLCMFHCCRESCCLNKYAYHRCSVYACFSPMASRCPYCRADRRDVSGDFRAYAAYAGQLLKTPHLKTGATPDAARPVNALSLPPTKTGILISTNVIAAGLEMLGEPFPKIVRKRTIPVGRAKKSAAAAACVGYTLTPVSVVCSPLRNALPTLSQAADETLATIDFNAFCNPPPLPSHSPPRPPPQPSPATEDLMAVKVLEQLSVIADDVTVRLSADAAAAAAAAAVVVDDEEDRPPDSSIVDDIGILSPIGNFAFPGPAYKMPAQTIDDCVNRFINNPVFSDLDLERCVRDLGVVVQTVPDAYVLERRPADAPTPTVPDPPPPPAVAAAYSFPDRDAEPAPPNPYDVVARMRAPHLHPPGLTAVGDSCYLTLYEVALANYHGYHPSRPPSSHSLGGVAAVAAALRDCPHCSTSWELSLVERDDAAASRVADFSGQHFRLAVKLRALLQLTCSHHEGCDQARFVSYGDVPSESPAWELYGRHGAAAVAAVAQMRARHDESPVVALLLTAMGCDANALRRVERELQTVSSLFG